MFKPMLAGKIEPPFELPPRRFPLLVSRKLDGVRATIQEGRVMSRSLKPIQNKFVQEILGWPELEGLDGELIVGDPTAPDAFRKTTSAVCSIEGKPQFTFHVFDCFDPAAPFLQRLAKAEENVLMFANTNYVQLVPHSMVMNSDKLLVLESEWVAAGYEGLMIRSVSGPYKQGRSTATEGWLVKLKRFIDAEGELLSINEQMHNENEATINELGHTARSSHKENKTPAASVGSLNVRNLETNVLHKVSPGCMTEKEAKETWENREKFVGRIVKFKFFPSGSKDKPRFSQFVGWRDPVDMDQL